VSLALERCALTSGGKAQAFDYWASDVGYVLLAMGVQRPPRSPRSV
jgi:hypothetical protein